jgi:D-proline reductase (dithiol) PrdB
MSENLNWLQKLSNRFYGVPAIAQLWARLTSGRTGDLTDVSGDIPFHRLTKPLSESRFALITTGGTHLTSQTPFDMDEPDGDPSFRVIPLDADRSTITITHKYYDHSDADRDLNIIFPIDHFEMLAGHGIVGELGPRHFGFMGHIDGPLISELTDVTAPQVAGMLEEDEVDAVLLTPA